MFGHEISVHTWSHPVSHPPSFLSSYFFFSLFVFLCVLLTPKIIKHLTSLNNEQVVAELGYTRKAIRSILGITPLTMRPPFGDIGTIPSSLPFVFHDMIFTTFLYR